MFKKLFDRIYGGIVDICKPGIDDPMCHFGGSPQNSDKQSITAAADENPKGIWREEKR